MGIKSNLLFSSYRTMKRAGYFTLRNSLTPYASILMYHRINNYDPECLSTCVDVFEETLAILRDSYNVIPLPTLVDLISRRDAIKPGTVVITFDDGYRDNILVAAPLLRKYNLPATFFVTSQYIGTNRIFPWDTQSSVKHELMSWDEVRELSRMGFEIGGHTANHVNLGTVELDEADKEISMSKGKIEDEIGRQITSFAYPFGGRDYIRKDIIPIIKKAGFKCCCSGYGGKVTKYSDPFALSRSVVYQTSIELFMEIDNFVTYIDGKTKIRLWEQHDG